MSFPPPDATRAEVDAWYAKHAPPPEPPHEAPACENGPSFVCNACGLVRINITKGAFCRSCSTQIAHATGEAP